MKIWSFLWVAAIGFVAGGAVMSQREYRQVVLDNDRVVVREVVLEPQVEYPEHTHSRPHLGVMISAGTLEFNQGNETLRMDFKEGDVGWREAGTTHQLINRSDHPVRFIEVEVK